MVGLRQYDHVFGHEADAGDLAIVSIVSGIGADLHHEWTGLEGGPVVVKPVLIDFQGAARPAYGAIGAMDKP